MKLTGLEIPSMYENVMEYLLFDYTDEIQLGKELCSVSLIRLETADLFKNRVSKFSDNQYSEEEDSKGNYIAVITITDHLEVNKKYCVKNMSGNFSEYKNLKNAVSDFILSEVYDTCRSNLVISIKI